MLTRTEVEKEYQVSPSGVVISPGKFEGEPWYVVSLWVAALDGYADRTDYDGDTEISSFRIDDEIVAMFGYRPTACDYIALWERSDGFVGNQLVTERSLDEIESNSSGEDGAL